MIGVEQLPTIPAGGSVIIEFEWDMSQQLQFFPTNDVSACLLASIENVTGDAIDRQATLWADVKHNNNLTMKNLVIRDAKFFKSGNRVSFFVGGNESPGYYDLFFHHPFSYSNSPLYEEAEITITLDEELWTIWDANGRLSSNITILDEDERLLLITNDNAKLQDVLFDSDDRYQVNLAVNFLTDQVTEQNYFPYVASQKFNSSETSAGAVHFNIFKEYRDLFYAEAGSDQVIYSGETTQLSATQINEPAVYNWYNSHGDLIFSGTDTVVSPSITEMYKLEVISLLDGFKDYDEVQIDVNDLEILEVSPNPANSMVDISYDASSCSSAYVMLLNVVSNISHSYILDTSQEEIAIDVSGFQGGLYKIILVCDGKFADESSLLIQ